MASTSAGADVNEVRAQLNVILTLARSAAGDDLFTPWQQVAVHVGHALGYLSLIPTHREPADPRRADLIGSAGNGAEDDAQRAQETPQQLRDRLRAVLDELDLLIGLDDVQAHHRRSLLLTLGRADEVLDVLIHNLNPAPSGPAAA